MCVAERNHILALLPEPTRHALARDWQLRAMRRGEVLVEHDGAIDALYFPVSGAISLMAECDEDAQIEVATADASGVFGSLLLLGDELSPWDAIVDLDGEALVIPEAAARRHAQQEPHFQEVMNRYSLLLFRWMAQTATCQTYHPVAKRLARWLLAMQDAAGEHEFAITQEFLARMLGVQRPSVTISAGALQRTGAVEFRRGRVRIRNRRILRSQSCSCYEALVEQRRRLLNGLLLH